MLKLVTVIGARPQIIKAAALSRAVCSNHSDEIEELIVHTGQHYDSNMSDVFFKELGIPRPWCNLNVGSGGHGVQTARMIEGLEKICLDQTPDAMVLYGDTNSTLAGAVVAGKLHIPIVHIEAGLRSFNKRMPEELNRILCDHSSTLLFAPTKEAIKNLVNEGFELTPAGKATNDNPYVYHCGDVMYDNSLHFGEQASSEILKRNEILDNRFILVTIHRDGNTDDPNRLANIFGALSDIWEQTGVRLVLPLHPRTRNKLEENETIYSQIQGCEGIQLIDPVSFLEMIALEKNCEMVITDSGGVQKEAFFFQKRCVVLRAQTEWVELVESGATALCDADRERIVADVEIFLGEKEWNYPYLFGNGKAAEFIASEMLRQLN